VQFVGKVIAGLHDARKDIAHFRFIIDQRQKGFSARTPLADTENVFRCRVQPDNQQVVIEQDHAGAERIDNVGGKGTDAAVVMGAGFAARAGLV